jgi:hypothetical protein
VDDRVFMKPMPPGKTRAIGDDVSSANSLLLWFAAAQHLIRYSAIPQLRTKIILQP